MNLTPTPGQVPTPSVADAPGAFHTPVSLDGDALIAEAVGEEEPEAEMDDSFSPTVTLPIGLTGHPDHGTVTTAEVRELTGHDEEHLARVSRDTPWRYQMAVVAAGVKSFGPGDKRVTDVLPDLSLGDLHFLTMMVRVATFGPHIDYTVACSKCSTKQEVTFILPDDVPSSPAPRTETQVTLRSGIVATVSTVTVQAQVKVLEASMQRKATDAETNTVLLGETVLGLSGGVWLGEESARALGVKDRVALLDAVLADPGGPDLSSVPVDCATCGHTSHVGISLTDLFR